ncbi:MAG: haloacid dehalogenase type II [Rhodospirillaceae bacterium]
MPVSEVPAPDVKVIFFDVFGTVVDWRTSLRRLLAEWGQANGVQADWNGFLDAWKAGYRPAMDAVISGARPWINLDDMYLERMGQVAGDFGLGGLTESQRMEILKLWLRIDPWPDAVEGLTRLAKKYTLVTLSNGSFAWLTAIAKHGRLPFDAVVTAENAKVYKPHPNCYLTAIKLMGMADTPGDCMLTACHNYDLAAGRDHGMKTAFLPRKEYGPDQIADQAPESDWDVVATGLIGVAEAMGC